MEENVTNPDPIDSDPWTTDAQFLAWKKDVEKDLIPMAAMTEDA